MNSHEAVWVTGNGRTLTREELDARYNSVARNTSLTATTTVTVEKTKKGCTVEGSVELELSGSASLQNLTGGAN